MKLMKRNNSVNKDEINKINSSTSTNKVLKFDWSKITDLNSSVHS